MEHGSGRKRQIVEISDAGGGDVKVYRFKVLLPNGTCIVLTLRDPEPKIPLEDFLSLVQEEYTRARRQSESMKNKSYVKWRTKGFYLEDANDNIIRDVMYFRNFRPHKCHILRLYDGSGNTANTFENMWDLTPDTDLLAELPEEYTFESALADLIDNSLQAVWSNGENEKRLIRVDILKDRISIFDSGPGMDGSDENSLVKWGKMGASLHRSSKGQAIGGKPPYLKPFFGMFGYGGPIASMHLGRHALVSSKSKESKKVFTLRLEREALLSTSGSEQTWRTDGGIRDPLDDEIGLSPQESFTKVEIFEPKIKGLDIAQLQCKLKDIYFPYIQCDEISNTGKTITPIEFRVNKVDLAEIEGGEVATTNLHSCNGPEFVLQLHFSYIQDIAAAKSPGLTASQKANARLKCIYFPIVEGKENIERVLEKLEAAGCGITETYETFSRVSIRRLGRLLPDARWALLPFMEPKQKKGEKAHLLKRCCRRVKCFIETDAGFNPTPSKTDLALHNPFTTALKNFGNKIDEKEKGVNVKIHKAGKLITPMQMEREYQDWILQMHDCYDEEVDCGEDPPVLIVSPANKTMLGFSSDVLRVHRVLKRKQVLWKCGQKIKVLKGACAKFHKNNVYATLEYFLLEGLQGDAGGEARIICRPLGVPKENGCVVELNDGNACLDVRGSVSLPIGVIDSGKCLAIEKREWDCQLEKQHLRAPSTIDLLDSKHCQELEIDGALPVDAPVYAGKVPPREIVAVIRPASFSSSSTSKNLDQKYIFKDDSEMSIKVKFRGTTEDSQDVQHIYSRRVKPSSRKGFHGLYIIPLGCKFPDLFKKAGDYTFSFSFGSNSQASSRLNYEKHVLVKASSKVGSWKLLTDGQSQQYCARVGSCFPPFSVACYDIYDNQIPFTSIPKVVATFRANNHVLLRVDKVKASFSSNSSTLKIKDLMIESNELDKIRPHYQTTLVVGPRDSSYSVSISCKVVPGSLRHVTPRPHILESQLFPGYVIKELLLEMFDAYNNHVTKGLEVLLNVDGFHIQDRIGPKLKVDDSGCIDLSGLLKVTAGYGKNASFSILSDDKEVFKKEFQIEKRELRAATRVPESGNAGSQMDVVFEIVNSEGDVDQTFHDEEKYGQSHTLTIKSESFNEYEFVRYAFKNGRCTVPAMPLPQSVGIFVFVASHSRYPELSFSFKVNVTQVPNLEHDGILSPSPDGKMLHVPDSSPIKNDFRVSILNEKVLQDDIWRVGMRIGDQERQLDVLNKMKVETVQAIIELQASVETCMLNNPGYLISKEEIMEHIENTGHSAASILCSLSRRIPFQEPEDHLMKDIVGLVALLGTVCNTYLSRILAEYLGQDKMLAVVCRSDAATSALEKSLYAEAAAVARSLNGRFLVICLDDIRPYAGEFERNDPQRKLTLENPTLPSGNIPLGFLGYAVNLINLDVHNLHTRTAAGHSLRETLFYNLFGELQVYETREQMVEAHACINNGAVSLDGGILRERGIKSLGYGIPEPEVCFPVITSDVQMHLYPVEMEILKEIEDNKLKLGSIVEHIEKETIAHEKSMKKFKKKEKKFHKLMDSMDSVLKYSPDISPC